MDKFDYLYGDEVVDCWYRKENKFFTCLRNSINCIDGLVSGVPIYRPHKESDSFGLLVEVRVTDIKKVSTALKILSRALDSRYGGPDGWIFSVEHIDVGNYFLLIIHSGFRTIDRDLDLLIAEANLVSASIMSIIDSHHLSFLHDNGNHINSNKLDEIIGLYNTMLKRNVKINDILGEG